MTDKLSVFNGALLLAGERFLSSLTEEREPRRLLDFVWDDNGVRACLEMGQWNFAMRTVQIDYDTSIEPDFGLRRAFAKPTDWVLTSALCSDEYFRVPVLQYEDEAGYWYGDIDTLYVRYVSDDVAYGLDYNKWPKAFTAVVHEYFCSRVVKKITGSQDDEIASLKRLDAKLLEAKNLSAMAGPTRFPAQGGWTRARMSRGASIDRGGRGSLIG